ncbi:hypothetical protein ACE41H_05720 [Paenibacillus enshidis]|uniref:Uncharacterized protein n=1 Tax=Paenibacillus enshidis TaxID=1458439 RepID=A0ABV5AQW3_9BACL
MNENLNLLTEMRKKYEDLKFQVETDDLIIDSDDWIQNKDKVHTILKVLSHKGILTPDELKLKLELVETLL